MRSPKLEKEIDAIKQQMMQEVYFVRALHAIQLRDFTREERLAYLNRSVPQTVSQTARSEG